MSILNSHRLFHIFLAALCVITFPLQSQAAPKAKLKAVQPAKERVVLMPLQLGDADQELRVSMESALVEGLQQRFEVKWGEEVEKKAREIFRKENLKHECNEERCMQGIAEAFQAELLAVANIKKQSEGYFLSLTVQNLYDHVVVITRSLPCKGCDAYAVVDKLKELVGAPVLVAAAPAAEPPQPKVNLSDPDTALWEEVKKSNAAEDYHAYLSQYPKGKYIALAKTKLARMKDEARAVAEQQDQQAWSDAQQSASQEGYNTYLSVYPQGRFATLAQARIAKIKEEADVEGKQHREQLAEEARQKREQAEAAKKAGQSPVMVRIPGKNYEMGKYEVTQKEWRDIMGSNPSKFSSCGDSCPVEQVNWNDIQGFLQKLNAKTGRQYRLPTEDEWEYACYGGYQTTYCGGNDINSVAWYSENSNSTTHLVGQKQANSYGLYDMSGNVWEWMENKYDNEHDWRSRRGGSWDNWLRNVRASLRSNDEPSDRNDSYGFRLARTLP